MLYSLYREGLRTKLTVVGFSCGSTCGWVQNKKRRAAAPSKFVYIVGSRWCGLKQVAYMPRILPPTPRPLIPNPSLRTISAIDDGEITWNHSVRQRRKRNRSRQQDSIAEALSCWLPLAAGWLGLKIAGVPTRIPWLRASNSRYALETRRGSARIRGAIWVTRFSQAKLDVNV